MNPCVNEQILSLALGFSSESCTTESGLPAFFGGNVSLIWKGVYGHPTSLISSLPQVEVEGRRRTHQALSLACSMTWQRLSLP